MGKKGCLGYSLLFWWLLGFVPKWVYAVDSICTLSPWGHGLLDVHTADTLAYTHAPSHSQANTSSGEQAWDRRNKGALKTARVADLNY